MIYFSLGLAFLIAFLAALFAYQNQTIIQVQFLKLQFHGSLALFSLALFGLGFLVNFFFTTASIIRHKWHIYRLRRRIQLLEDKLADQERRPVYDREETTHVG